MKRFPDVDYGKWYGKYVQRATDNGTMIGDDEGRFRPDDPLTRAEAAVIVCRILDRLERPGRH